MDISKSISDGQRKVLFGVKEECKVSYLKLVVWSIVCQKGTNILFFYIFEYGGECSAESGAK